MKITVINGSPRKGNTYLATQIFKEEMQKKGEVEFIEIFLPKDMPEFCHGCTTCILKGEEKCSHNQYVKPILEAMLESDGLIFTSPVYVYDVSGVMKNFLDHFGYLWLPHRPNAKMFSKKAYILITAAGSGIKGTIKTIVTNLKFWGVNRVYSKGFPVFSERWQTMPAKKQERYERILRKEATKFYKEVESKKIHLPYFSIRFIFFAIKMMIKGYDESSIDKKYWKEKGWLDKKNPFGKNAIL
jgi:multimeric flavodoxin WrbA